ncbi:MAG: autotransporter outer membrane beta-barrel domain-containing protein [Geminicoccaceae bacterium]
MIRMDNVDENGPPAEALDVDSQTETFLSLEPALEIARDFALAEGWWLAPRASVGFTRFLTGNEPNVQASFAAAPGAGGISGKSSLDRTYLDFGLGIDLVGKRGLTFGTSGFARLGDDTETYGVSLDFTYRF